MHSPPVSLWTDLAPYEKSHKEEKICYLYKKAHIAAAQSTHSPPEPELMGAPGQCYAKMGVSTGTIAANL